MTLRFLKRFTKDIISLIDRKKPSHEHQDKSSSRTPIQDSIRPANFEFLLSQRNISPPLPGVSLVAACMNREENLMKVLGSWLATEADEIVIVDWSSTSEVWPKLSAIDDPRIKVLRIDGEQKWVLSHAFNVGLRFASHELVFKLDCDIKISQDFLKVNNPQPGEFVRGFWKLGLKHGGEGQQFINGTFGAYKKDLREANYYDERILTYGWDDSDLYMRLSHDLGLAGKLIDPNTLRHLEQAQDHRTASQHISKYRFLGKYEPTEFEGAKNKYYTAIAGNWATWFPSQDYGISEVEKQFFQGSRVTNALKHNADFDLLSEVLAAKDLAVWALPTMPEINSIEFSSLILSAHKVNKSSDLIEGIKNSKDLYFIHCEPGPCREALQKTLHVMRRHYPTFADGLVLTESQLEFMMDGAPTGYEGNVLFASEKMLEKLSGHARAKEIKGIGDLEELLESGDREAWYLSLSVHSLSVEVIQKAAKFSEALGNDFAVSPKPIAKSCLVTSLFDEQNLIRLVEYLACVVENLRIFEQIVIYYEATNGLLARVLHEISEELAILPGRLLLLPYQKRPTFEELFSVQSILPSGTIIAAANADVVFDASFSKVTRVDLSRNIVVLSRRDISRDGCKAVLIHIENGMPNTYSSDAWITSTPFKPDFLLDYLIGTMQCDSYINHQLSKSSRYGVINPCLEIKVFHLHDDRFNSSTEKAERDFEVMKENYNRERRRNDGADPVKGIAWSTLATAAIVPGAIQFQPWNSKVIILDLGRCTEVTFGHFLILHLLCQVAHVNNDNALSVRLRKKDLEGPLGILLARYQRYFSLEHFLLDLENESDLPNKYPEKTFVRSIDFEKLSECVITGAGDALKEKTSELLAWSSDNKLIRCDITGDMATEITLNLISALRQQKDPSLKSLFEFFNGLQDYSVEKNLLTPFIIPQLPKILLARDIRTKISKRPSVSFVTSLFKGSEFLPGYLENVFTAARKIRGEVIIIDANKDDYDSGVVKEFLDKHPDSRNIIDYVRMDKDPGLYNCWKLGIERSRADLITNANIDDRRCPHHTLRLVQILNEHPEYAGACGSISCVKGNGKGGWFALEENEIWFYNEPINEIRFPDLYRINERGVVMSRNVMHCMPVWRKSLHEHYGYFDEKTYGTSADWAFWLKCAKAGERFIFDKTAFGRYYSNPESHNRRNDPDGSKERRIIKDFIGIKQSAIIKQ